MSAQATESELAPQELWAGRLGVQLRGLLEQQQAASLLLTTKLAQAASAICDLGGAVNRFPSMLSSLRPSMHILAGALFCRALRCPKAAANTQLTC